MKHHVLACTIAASMLAAAHAAVTPIGPFSGDESETFESIASQSAQVCITPRVFNNNADFCTVSGSGGLWITSGHSFVCQISPQAGSKMAFDNTPAEFTFDDGIQDFGGYWGGNWAAGALPTGTIQFFDAGGTMIDSQPIPMGNCADWVWNGWTSDEAFTRVVIISGRGGGGFMHFDSLEMTLFPVGPPPPPPDPVPASSRSTLLVTLALMSLALVTALGRHRA